VSDDEPLRILEVLTRTEQYLGKAGIEGARLDAEVLLAHVLGLSRIELYTLYDRPLSPDELRRYRETVRRRADREPVAYLTGVKEFHSLAFEVSPAVLVPRPETEHLVDEAVAISEGHEAPRLLDVGTGSGAIAVSWATEVPLGTFVATDSSPEALLVARKNAERHGVTGRGAFLEGDLFEPALPHAPFDLVACNPPYVAPGEETDPECLHEPAKAVFTDGDPLEAYRRLLTGVGAVLEEGGRFLLELPGRRSEEISALAPEGITVERIVSDYHGLARVLIARAGG
jgi:release factor glutamine methyltransferase